MTKNDYLVEQKDLSNVAHKVIFVKKLLSEYHDGVDTLFEKLEGESISHHVFLEVKYKFNDLDHEFRDKINKNQ